MIGALLGIAILLCMIGYSLDQVRRSVDRLTAALTKFSEGKDGE